MQSAKFYVIGVCFVVFAASVCGAPLDDSDKATILRYDNDNGGLDGYNFAYETSDGVTRQEQAELKNAGTDQEALSVRGSVSWVAPDGQTYTLNYIADENGFQPQGDHLPHN
ncbi:endocuticle structural protein SgAbd-6-like [Scaptodrosophila lebanonensis]|uniref:Endocuticle structural protein SgAbd-6-like n=1 Tax=Drosophila lebanonensis TaxID=7225 RepID=A0A6J2UE49_DROLE|nr:endocuticle structural protein SgAbd-6-like [Scaptodrosophila lebanonensis]